MKNKFLHIRERFPGKSRILDGLIKNDPGFQELCEDYDACIYALQYWSKSQEAEAEIRYCEYLTLINDLEKEIEKFLSGALSSENK